MAPGLRADRADTGPEDPYGASGAVGARRAESVRRVLLAGSVTALLLVGLSRPNAAQPELAPRGWAPGTVLPVTLDPAAVTAVLWAAYLAGALALLLAHRLGPAPLRGWRVPGVLAAVTLVAAPFGSADHVSYLAYGRILVTGGNPWLVSPVDWAGGQDPVTSRVEAPWTEEPSVYGPFATAVFGLAARIGGDSLREGVWVWQLVCVLCWLGVRLALRAALPRELHGRVDAFWTLNPFVLGLGVLGAHVDLLAAALVVAAVLVASRSPGPAGAVAAGVLVGLAGSSKVTYAVALVALVFGWWLLAGRGLALRRGVGVLAGMLLVALPLHVWAGPHVYDQLGRSRQAVSLATPWRLLLEAVSGVGPVGTRTVISIGAALLAVVLAVALARLSRPATPATGSTAPLVEARDGVLPTDLAATVLWVLVVLHLAYSLAASYTLPWYDLLVWAGLPAVLPGVVGPVAVVRGLVGAVAYVPGRVLGMTPGVEDVTLGVRSVYAPVVVGALWVLVIALGVARGGSVRPDGPRAGRPTPRAR